MGILTRYGTIIAVAILTLFAITSLQLAWDDSATFDEVAHIGAAYSYVTEFDYRLNPEHPPLLKLFAGLPLLATTLTFDTTQDFWTTISTDYPGEYGQWSAGRHLLYGAGNNPDIVLMTARAGMIAIAVLFGILIFVVGRRLAGVLGGLFALLLFVLSPGVLGHSHYITTDIGAAFFITLSIVTFARFLQRSSWRTALIAGACLGLAQVAKFSALLLIPLFAIVLFAHPIITHYKTSSYLRKIFSDWGKGLVAGLVGVVVVWLVYAPFTVSMPTEVFATLATTRINPDMGTQYQLMQSAVLDMNESNISRPFAAYIHGIAQVLSRVAGGNQITFFGTVTSDAPTGYFPIIYLIKETLPHIALAILAIFTFVATGITGAIAYLRKRDKKSNIYSARVICAKIRNYITEHATEITLLLFIILYSYISITGNLAIGYRHLFPIIPLIYLLTAATIARGIARLAQSSCGCANRLRISTILLLIFLIWEAVVSYPYYLSYFNQVAGGPTNGWQLVTDSNADWGQDLKRLDKWITGYNSNCAQLVVRINDTPCAKIPIEKIRIDYFGGGNPAQILGNKYEGWWSSRRQIESGWYAISVNPLQESILHPNATTTNSYLWLNQYTPIAQVGTSILVYYIETPPDFNN